MLASNPKVASQLVKSNGMAFNPASNILAVTVGNEVDTMHSAINAMGFKDIEIVAAETGWPHGGDPNEVGPSLDNAKTYVGNLINHLKSKVGTPLMPGKSIDTYFFSLYDENKKPGPSSEKYFGLFKPDGSTSYDVGLLKNTQGNINYACGQQIDCRPIQPGGVCFELNTVQTHDAYAMNLYYQSAGRNPWNSVRTVRLLIRWRGMLEVCLTNGVMETAALANSRN
ncbi:unnamed protein product [Fraxinus pennsylvanica]|uniref:X8 domain-containing protein n=1 Tax=Fraxinus pennsylvanica TaxID=56036 RepID=A0AAD2A6P2_9LAMI|nr:unnamed protein product [Fraxinus pennsylvanica]